MIDWELFAGALQPYIEVPKPIRIKNIKEGWLEGKKELIPLFGEDGRISMEVDYSEIGSSRSIITVLRDSLAEFSDNLARKDRFRKIPLLGGHLFIEAHYIVFETIQSFNISPTELINNVLAMDMPLNSTSIHNSLVIRAGTKTSKAIKTLLKRKYQLDEYNEGYNSDEFNDSNQSLYGHIDIYLEFCDLLISKIIEQLKTQYDTKNKVTVVVSINPLDILLQSNHTTGWSSCHRIHGSQRTGPIACIGDAHTAVAYAYKKKQALPFAKIEKGRTVSEQGPLYPVKIWRKLIFIDINSGVAVMGREYPSNKSALAKIARKLIGHALAKHLELPTKWKIRHYANNEMYETPNPDEEITSEGQWYRNFDVWVYQDNPTKLIYFDKDKLNKQNFKIGRFVTMPTPRGPYSIPCVVCDKPRDINSSNERLSSLMHEKCKRMPELCAHCSVELDSSYASSFSFSSYRYCLTCRDLMFEVCDKCGVWQYKADTRYGPLNTTYCIRCCRDMIRCARCGKYTNNLQYTNSLKVALTEVIADTSISSFADLHLTNTTGSGLCVECIT